MRRWNHFQKAQLKLTAQYFVVSLVIIVLANFLAIRVAHRTFLRRDAAVIEHARNRAKIRPAHGLAEETHGMFRGRLLVADAYLLIVAVAASYFLSGRALKPIREMVRRQEEFASDVSHELRTPLATIFMEIEALRRTEPELPGKYAELLDSVQEETRHMTGTVSGLLTLVRPEPSSGKNSRLPLDLAAIAEQAVERAGARALNKKISFTAENLNKAPIIGNEEQIRQVVLILLDNAIRYTSNGGTVTLATANHNKTSSLSVADTGVGIPVNDQARIFERFYRVPDNRMDDGHGAGLGLAIARKIVEDHGGTISVNSTPGKGSTFTINLPRQS